MYLFGKEVPIAVNDYLYLKYVYVHDIVRSVASRVVCDYLHDVRGYVTCALRFASTM